MNKADVPLILLIQAVLLLSSCGGTKPEVREFHVVHVGREHPRPLDFNMQPDHMVKYTGKAISVKF